MQELDIFVRVELGHLAFRSRLGALLHQLPPLPAPLPVRTGIIACSTPWRCWEREIMAS
jgi:hypothetical protein